jgi:alkylation response protein AidB-like acyl-CoA dehydrogenase
MDLDYPADTAAFRAELEQWLTTELDAVRAEAGAEANAEIGADAALAARWQQVLHAAGWATPTWPPEYGGRGLDALHATLALDVFHACGAPFPLPSGGELLLGPTILHWGTDEQRARFLPPIARAEQTWCQGFSEPGSGSDLASLQTRAGADGADWVLNGHKIWTSEAQDADFMFTLAVTDPDVRPHHGITYFLVPMDQDGIEVRAIAQPDARAGFNEVILHDVRCPGGNVLGGVGQGWQVAMGTLGIERGVSSSASHLPYLTEWQDAVAAARANGRLADPDVRNRLVRAWSDIELLRLQSMRLLTSAVHGPVDPQVEVVGASYKMFYTELHQRLADLAMDIHGAEAALLTGDQGAAQPAGVGLGRREAHHVYPLTGLQSVYLFSRSQTIYGGTSQVQRSIVAERVLGLPRSRR